MGLPIAADETGPVHTEDDVQPFERYIVDHHVKAPLQKARIHGEDRHKPLLCHGPRHGDGVPLGDTDIEKAPGECILKALGPGAAGHGSRDHDDASVLLGSFAEIFPHLVRKTLADRGKLPGHGVKGPDAVVLVGVGLGVRAALPLLCQDMQQHRPPQLSRETDGVFELVHVMPVHGAEIV